jgi:hypothetical protein
MRDETGNVKESREETEILFTLLAESYDRGSARCPVTCLSRLWGQTMAATNSGLGFQISSELEAGGTGNLLFPTILSRDQTRTGTGGRLQRPMCGAPQDIDIQAAGIKPPKGAMNSGNY